MEGGEAREGDRKWKASRVSELLFALAMRAVVE